MPPTITAHFKQTGGPLLVMVRCGFANPGSYGLTLLGPGATTIVQQLQADFGTVAQNTHELGAASKQNGRVIDVIAAVGLLDPAKAYSVFLTVIQDDQELGTISEIGTGTGLTKLVELIVMLSGAAAVVTVAPTLAPTAESRGVNEIAPRTTRRADVKGGAGTTIEDAKDAAKAPVVDAQKKKNASNANRSVEP
ncbi:MAG: hypothetical protein ABI120_22475 [Gemmatimonadaceae bacterium]